MVTTNLRGWWWEVSGGVEATGLGCGSREVDCLQIGEPANGLIDKVFAFFGVMCYICSSAHGGWGTEFGV